MPQYIKFPSSFDTPSRWGGQEIPKHTQDALEDYLIRGYPPGGFLTAILTNDLYRAVASADHANKTNITAITDWVLNYAPERSWGSPDMVQMWLDDEDNRRTKFSEATQKAYTWAALHDAS